MIGTFLHLYWIHLATKHIPTVRSIFLSYATAMSCDLYRLDLTMTDLQNIHTYIHTLRSTQCIYLGPIIMPSNLYMKNVYMRLTPLTVYLNNIRTVRYVWQTWHEKQNDEVQMKWCLIYTKNKTWCYNNSSK